MSPADLELIQRLRREAVRLETAEWYWQQPGALHDLSVVLVWAANALEASHPPPTPETKEKP